MLTFLFYNAHLKQHERYLTTNFKVILFYEMLHQNNVPIIIELS